MKTITTQNVRERGNSLMIALILTGILSFTIAGYLSFVSQQNQMTWRSQYWNQCIPVAEAGIEDSLMNLSCNGVSNLTAGGWSAGTNCYYVDRSLAADNSVYYHAVITGNYQQTTNTATAQVVLPSYLGGATVTRTVRVITTNSPLFSKGLVGIDTIDFNNQSVSMGCGDTSPGGSGSLIDLNIAASLGLLNLLDICLQGSVALGPNGLAVGANAQTTGIINASASTDLNVQFNAVTLPTMSSVPPISNYKQGSQTYAYAASGDTTMGSLNLTGNQVMLITGNTRLYVSGNINIQNNACIYVAPGASLQIYAGGATSTFGGNGVEVASQNPLQFQYYGLSSNTSVSFDGPSSVQGLVYAPQAAVQLGTTVATGGILGLGATLDLTFNGAVIGQTVKFLTQTEYHYDEDVLTSGPGTGFVVTSWQEL
jgi:hypothetical protein